MEDAIIDDDNEEVDDNDDERDNDEVVGGICGEEEGDGKAF